MMFQRLALTASLCALVSAQPIGAFAQPAAPVQPPIVPRSLDIYAVCLDKTGGAPPDFIAQGVRVGAFPNVRTTTFLSRQATQGYRVVAIVPAQAIDTAGVPAPAPCIGAVVAIERP
jgi:hypothetical protein